MKVISDKFELEHKPGLTEYENNNSLSRKLIITLIRLKDKLKFEYKYNNFVYLVDFDLYLLLESSPNFSIRQHSTLSDIILNKYFYGGMINSTKLYYTSDINKIYCGTSIEEMDRYVKVSQRKKKLEKIKSNI